MRVPLIFLFGHFMGFVTKSVSTVFNNLTEKELFIYLWCVFCDIFFSLLLLLSVMYLLVSLINPKYCLVIKLWLNFFYKDCFYFICNIYLGFSFNCFSHANANYLSLLFLVDRSLVLF